jgi:Tfp pilus assembly protein PilF
VLRGRADTYLGIGKHAEALADYEKAYQLNKEDSGLLNNFAWVLATSPVDKVRNGRRAIELAAEACRLTDYKQAHILSTLAAAYAEAGDFDKAKEFSQKAVDEGREKLKPALRKELDSYKARKPWREFKTGNEKEEDDEEDSPAPEKPKSPPAETPKPKESEKPK